MHIINACPKLHLQLSSCACCCDTAEVSLCILYDEVDMCWVAYHHLQQLQSACANLPLPLSSSSLLLKPVVTACRLLSLAGTPLAMSIASICALHNLDTRQNRFMDICPIAMLMSCYWSNAGVSCNQHTWRLRCACRESGVMTIISCALGLY